jgi:hypothetical protein
MDYLIKVPKMNTQTSLSITNSNDEVVGIITIQKTKLKIKEYLTNNTYFVTSSPLKLNNRFIIYLGDEVMSRIHIGKKIIHSIIEHDEYLFVKSSLFQSKYRVYHNRDVISTLELIKKNNERFYKITSINDDFIEIISLFLIARAIRIKALFH